MAVHRTREQKIKAKQRLEQMTQKQAEQTPGGGYSFSANELTKPVEANLTPAQLSHNQTVVKDLMKTMTISVILMAIVVGIYFYLRYN